MIKRGTRAEAYRQIERLLTPESLQATIAEIMPAKIQSARERGRKEFLDYQRADNIVILNQPRDYNQKGERKY